MSRINALASEVKIPTEIQKVHLGLHDLYIKREDLNHPLVQGNKWRKLKHNLEAYLAGAFRGIVSFGGLFSNHVFALASACEILQIPCKLFLRGYTLDKENPTVKHLLASGAELTLLEPKAYRLKSEAAFIKSLMDQKYFVIPEGGSNTLGIKGAIDLGKEIIEQMEMPPDYVCVSAGTGGTAIGLIKAFANVKTEVIVFSSLKGDFLHKVIQDEVGEATFRLMTDYHFGGYGKFSRALIDFCNHFKRDYNIPLEPVYTGKMFYGIQALYNKGHFRSSDTVVAIHTGGLQGIKGYNYRYTAKYGGLDYC